MYNSTMKFRGRMMTTVAALLLYASAALAAQAQGAGAGVGVGGIATAGAGGAASPTGGLGGGAGANTPQANGADAGLGLGASNGQDASGGAGLGTNRAAAGLSFGLPVGGIAGAPANPGQASSTLISQFNSLDSVDRIAIKRRCSQVVGSPSRQDGQLVALCKMLGK
jgi:hypothetical protein